MDTESCRRTIDFLYSFKIAEGNALRSNIGKTPSYGWHVAKTERGARKIVAPKSKS